MKKRCDEDQIHSEDSVGMSEEELIEARERAKKSVIRYSLIMLLAVLAVIILSYFISQRNMIQETMDLQQAAGSVIHRYI